MWREKNGELIVRFNGEADTAFVDNMQAAPNLYFVSYDNGTTFKVIGSFSASYSVFFDMEEKEVNDGSDNGSKYYILKEIVLIDSALSLTSTNIQRKDVYVWNYDKERFVLAESSRIVSEENADIPIIILSPPSFS